MLKNYFLNILSILTLVVVMTTADVSVAKKVDQSTDKVNKSLRITNDKGDIDEYKATVAEVLVIKNEAKAMQQLAKLLAKYHGTPLEPGLLFRKAELFVRQSKSARFFEYTRGDNNLMTMIPTTMKSATTKGKVQQAVAIYEEIQKRFPNYAELDAVYFNNAFLRQQLGEDKVAEKMYHKLLKDFPESVLVPDSHLSLAEMLYQQRRYADALPEYEAIKQYPLARVYPYAVYKEGWDKYQLKDVKGAIKELETVIEISNTMTAQENAKLNLKHEALNDLVLFYPEANSAKNAFAYFKKWAGDEAGKYLISLSEMYERHSNFQDLEVVLNDLISSMPQSPDSPVAFRSLLENDINARNYTKATGHLSRFENHCTKYFANDSLMNPVQMKAVTDADKKNVKNADDFNDDYDDAKSKNCYAVLNKESLKMAVKWHKSWQKKYEYSQKEKLPKADLKSIDTIADATELSYSIYLRNTPFDQKQALVRFNYAELLFQRKNFRLASLEYYKTSDSIKDPKVLHQASYYAIVSLESAVGEKWSDTDEGRYTELAKSYITKNPTGKFVNEVRFKKAFIAYEKGRYDEAAPEFKKIGWGQADEKLVVKSQDLYLDILNIQKKYKDLIEATDGLMKQKLTPDRKTALMKVNRESNFSYAMTLEQKGNLDEAIAVYDRFSHQNQDSKLADKAQWNMTQILIKQNQLKMAADKSFELYKMFPNSEFAKPSLKKSAELYEFMADTSNTALALRELAKVEPKESFKWLKLSADFFVLSGDFKRGVDIYKDVLKVPDDKTRKEIVSSLTRVEESKVYASKDMHELIVKYGGAKYSDEAIISAQRALETQDFGKAFKLASQIVGDKNAPYDMQAKARLVQAEILKDEFVNQSVKSKVDRLQTVLTLKTQKLDKAQRAFQATIKYGDSDTALRAFFSLAKMYEHYVDAMRSIKITDEISDKDKKLLMGEIEQIVIPIEEKIADTLQQGLDFSRKYPSYDGYAFQLRNELNKVNFKGLKFVKYDVLPPQVAVPSAE
jgi:TolA-binding protein